MVLNSVVYIKFMDHRLEFPYEDVFPSLKIVYYTKQQVPQPKHTLPIKNVSLYMCKRNVAVTFFFQVLPTCILVQYMLCLPKRSITLSTHMVESFQEYSLTLCILMDSSFWFDTTNLG